jgi:PAS domain S-box-containing protein
MDTGSRKIAFANDSFYGLLGYTPADTGISGYDIAAHSREAENEMVASVMKSGKVPNQERAWKHKNGDTIYVLCSSLYTQVGERHFICVTGQNITERKKEEEKLSASNKELSSFIDNASRDLRGPLASIQGLVNLSRLGINSSQSNMEMIEAATHKIDDTLRQLEKAMKIKSLVQFNDEIDFENLIRDIMKKFTHLNGFGRLKVELDIAFRGIFISNKVVIETILHNIIENAVTYQNPSAGTPAIKVQVLGDKQEIQLIVEDNGTGIEEAMQGNIFDMYFRGNEGSHGSGLGLYLVKKGVDLLKGTIQLRSVAGKGSVFTVLLPCKSVKPAARLQFRNESGTFHSLYAGFINTPFAS